MIKLGNGATSAALATRPQTSFIGTDERTLTENFVLHNTDVSFGGMVGLVELWLETRKLHVRHAKHFLAFHTKTFANT